MRWKPSLLQKLPLFAFLATFPSQLWSWNKFFPPPAPPSHFSWRPCQPWRLKQQMTHPPCVLTEEAAVSSVPHPPPQEPPQWRVTLVLTGGQGFPHRLSWLGFSWPSSLGNCPGAWEPRWGFAPPSSPALEPNQPPKGQWLPHQLHHPQSPGLTWSFFCFAVNIM